MPRCGRGVGIGAREQDAAVGDPPVRAPDLLAGHHPAVAVALGAGLQRREVGAGVGLGEQLAPHPLAGDDRPQVLGAAARACRTRAARRR